MYREVFEMGDRVVCIKQYETLKIGSHYSIKGCGDLSWNAASDKKGYGFCIEDEWGNTDQSKTGYWNIPYKDRVKWYYFTEEEMCDFFITEQSYYISYTRDIKIDSILDGNR